MTHALSSRVTSRKLTVCSILFISVNVLAAAHEVVGGVYGAVASTAGLAVGASCTSALVCILFLAWLARFTPSVSSWIAAFSWGSGGALIIAGIGNGMINAAVEATSLGEDAADVVTSVVTGPLVEEAAKGIGVLIIILAVRRLLEHPAQGAVFGALVGAGFAWGEDIGYYVSALDQGMSGLWESFLARALLGGYGHAVYAGILGWALAWASLRRRNVLSGVLVGIGGYLVAVLAHSQANAVGFLAPDENWNLVYGCVELPVLILGVVLLVWGMRRRRTIVEA